ncbi:MAG: hypothetical protein HN348_34455, partial [Proteobacteria bacterium]|nr:hypothetical protein [Pseudomonadota bacterium]
MGAKLDGFDDTDDTDFVGHCQITNVEPNFGTTAGGVKVSLTVDPVGDAPTVFFGNKEAEVIATGSTEIKVRTPEAKKDGPKSVQVVYGDESCILEEGFTYHEDGEGKQGTIGAFFWMLPQGTYWGDDEAWGEAYFAFVEPTDVSYRDFWGSTMNSCSNDYVPDTNLQIIDTPLTARLQNGAAIIDLDFSSEALEYQTMLVDGDFLHQSSYDLMPNEGQGWPAFDVEHFIRTPPSIRIVSPDVDGDEMAVVYEDDLTLHWNSAGSGDYVIAQLNLYDYQGKYVERVRCLLNDDGSHTVYRSIWDHWTDYGYIVLNVGRV